MQFEVVWKQGTHLHTLKFTHLQVFFQLIMTSLEWTAVVARGQQGA